MAPSVKNGVELWRANDYAGAVAMWQPYANAGDADAMFNIGQAYKLGRAVPKDPVAARDWYRKAALKGHLPAQANLGILLFQAGDKAEAIRWLKAAADKNEMRAQYVLGVASWNGDGVPRSMTLAYGYLARASAQGLPEATTALNNLTGTISPVERANGWAVATSLAANNGVPTMFVPGGSKAMASTETYNREQLIKATPRPATVVAQPPAINTLPPKPAVEVAAATVPASQPPVAQPPIAPPTAPAANMPAVAPGPAQTAVAGVAAPRPSPVTPPATVASTVPPKPVPAAPPVAVASAATARPASPAPTNTAPSQVAAQRPAAPVVTSVTIPPATPAPSPPKPVEVAAAPPKAVVKPATKPVEVADARPLPKVAPKQPSAWRIQLGAFAKKTQAEAAWTEVKTKQKQLVGAQKPIYEADGGVTKLQMGPYTTQVAARDACARIAFTGRACFVTAG